MIELEQNMLTIYGAAGKAWLERLPDLQNKLALEFGLRDLKPMPDLSYNYVASGLKNNVPIVLKIGLDKNSIESEYYALNAFDGHGIIKLLAHSAEYGAIVLSRAIPGDTLISLFPEQDLKALNIACDLITNAHENSRHIYHKFPLLQDWLSIIDQDWDVIDKKFLQLAKKLKQTLLHNTNNKPVLLHGDLHYANIISNGDDWIIIDPKGVIGDPLYDITGALLREPFAPVMASNDIKALLRSRMQFVATYVKCEIDLIWSWTFVQTVMSICWSLEDGQDVTQKLQFLNILHALQQEK